VRSPTDTQAASAVTVQTLSAADTPVLIDEKTDVESAAITPGALGGTLTYIAAATTAGVVSTHTLKFKTAGRVEQGGRITLAFPDGENWDMPAAPTIAFVGSSVTADAGGTAWDYASRTLTVVTASADIAAETQVELTVDSARSAAGSQAASEVTVQTLSALSVLIDEKTGVESPAITVGALASTLTYELDTATPGVPSTHTLSFTTSGRVNSGGKITLQFPEDEGWDMASAPTVAFSPAIGSVTVAGSPDAPAWASGTRTLTVTTGGAAIPSAQEVIMTVAGVRSPTDTQAASAVTVQTLSADSRVIDEKTDVESAAITPGALGGTLTYVPSTATPGVVSTHTLKFSTAGQVPLGGQITLQ